MGKAEQIPILELVWADRVFLWWLVRQVGHRLE